MDEGNEDQTVTATEFQQSVGLFMEKSGKSPVFITKYDRPVRVLLDADEYKRLKRKDIRVAVKISDASDEDIRSLLEGKYGTTGLEPKE